jgi:hypothetical protein
MEAQYGLQQDVDMIPLVCVIALTAALWPLAIPLPSLRRSAAVLPCGATGVFVRKVD